jgi:hypothetical protein
VQLVQSADLDAQRVSHEIPYQIRHPRVSMPLDSWVSVELLQYPRHIQGHSYYYSRSRRPGLVLAGKR